MAVALRFLGPRILLFVVTSGGAFRCCGSWQCCGLRLHACGTYRRFRAWKLPKFIGVGAFAVGVVAGGCAPDSSELEALQSQVSNLETQLDGSDEELERIHQEALDAEVAAGEELELAVEEAVVDLEAERDRLKEEIEEKTSELALVSADLETALEAQEGVPEELVEEASVSAPAAVVTAPAPPSTPRPSQTADPAPVATQAPAPASAPVATNTYYKNCTEARNEGAAPVYKDDPGYGRHLDRDGDGIGCE